MLSRVADSIYWMSRYIERAENVARFIDVNLKLMLDIPDGAHDQWEPLVNVTGERDFFLEHYDEFNQSNVIRFLTFDQSYPNSIFSCLASARENARSIREVISDEMWEQINIFYLSIKHSSNSNLELDQLHNFYHKIRNGSSLFNGVTDSTMSHGEGWNFARLGRMLERADKTSRIVDMKYFILLPKTYDVGTPIDNIQWSALLSSTSGFHMYKQRYGAIDPKFVAQFLILDRLFPRAIRYCLIKAEDSLHEISGAPVGTFTNDAEQYLGKLRSEIDFTTITEVIARGMHEYLDEFQLKLNKVSDKIFETFFDLEHGPTNTYTNQEVRY